MVKDSTVTSRKGQAVSLKADTVCIHGDGAHALTFAKTIKKELKAADIQISALAKD